MGAGRHRSASSTAKVDGSGGHQGGAGFRAGDADVHEGQFEPEVLEDGRMRCVYCGRHFNPDRIDQHQQICGKLKNARPKGVDGQPTQASAKVFNAEAQRLETGAVFVAPEKYQRLQEQKQEAAVQQRARAMTPKWRREHTQFVQACRAGRGDSPAPASPGRPATGLQPGMVQCQHCLRQFTEHAAERHIPICAKVRNRPRPPPSPTPRRTSGGAMQRSMAESVRGGLGLETTMAPPSPPVSKSPRRSMGSRNSSAPCLLPAVDGTGASTSSLGSAGTAGGQTGVLSPKRLGGASSKLPRFPTPPSARSAGDPSDPNVATMKLSIRDGSEGGPLNGTSRPPRAPRAAPAPAEPAMDSTGASLEAEHRPGDSAVARVGLRRCAMVYRLLSHVPPEALERELADAGVATEHLDQEGMIEEILKQLT
eukprot:CAMPEP_0179223534 /NCGR_PEP_ID=MMETSP0797-20121207/7291_1 /TAXON_ID=47934 /ORGANISM="Dinophysis acuminata, Strain DAEP01" /LENGTH=423 /DNA_ID=CAMNT_0020930421 /DNA_START=248 /DNA_END=1519 /DNA_ORIENTATION=+